MDLFLSWSGTKSCKAAQAFHEWIRYVINAVNPWMSKENIAAGARWTPEIQKQLENSRFGIIFVTRSNAESPWLMFEAGAIAKTVTDTFVCPYLLDFDKPSELPSGPLTQFQAKMRTKSDTYDLLRTINTAVGEDGLDEERLGHSFEKWWPDLESKLENLPSEPIEKESRGVQEMVEEILVLTRDLRRVPTSPFAGKSSSSRASGRRVASSGIKGFFNSSGGISGGIPSGTVTVVEPFIVPKGPPSGEQNTDE